MKFRLLLFILFVPFISSEWSENALQAQVISVSPVFPNADDTITITFDATQGNGALTGVSPVYGHIGLITSNSTSPTDWQYVVGNWGQADPATLMTDLGNNLHQIKYHIRSFHGVPTTETVLQLAFVFRNADGSIVGRAASGSDIYYNVYSSGSGLIGQFITPSQNQIAVASGATIPVSAAASGAATMTLFDNGTQIAQSTNATSLGHTITATATGLHLVELVVDDTINPPARDTFYYTVNPPVPVQTMPAGTELGVNYLNDSTVRLRLYAPNKQYIYVIGDFNNWQFNPNYYMKRDPDGANWWLDITGLTPDTEYAYQYAVDDNLVVADPLSELVLDPFNDGFISNATYPNLKPYPTGKTTGIVSVMHPGRPAYNWQITNFQKPAKEELVVYELLIRDFIAAHDYQTLIDTLDYLERLGINAIELMPVNEFEGNESWGYNPSFHMALDKYYGSIDDFKAFIDECHSRGIAVIVDVVYNHAFSQSPLCQLYWNTGAFQPSADNPWLNETARHPFNVGYDFNHEAQPTKDWVHRVMKYWIEEFKIDGFRFDLSKGFTQTNHPNNVGAWSAFDQSRIDILEEYADTCWATDPDFYVILEHLGDNAEESVLSDYGMMLWGNMNYSYNEATMGYVNGSNFAAVSHQSRGWNDPHLIGYMESHDEERLIYRNLNNGNSDGSYNTRDLNTALKRVEMAAAFFFTIPGPKMLWQFGELGYDISIDNPCRVCNKPILWNYQQDFNRNGLYKAFSAFIQLRNDYETFHTDNFNLFLGNAAKAILLNHPDMNALVVGNFDVKQASRTVVLPSMGWWYDFITGDSLNVTNTSQTFTLAPGEYHLYTTQRITPTAQAFVDNFEIEKDNDNGFLLNAYPNPAQTQTTIAYYLANGAKVEVAIYNMLGQRVATLANEYQAIGDQYIELNTNELNAGQYIVRLVVDGAVATKTIRVLK